MKFLINFASQSFWKFHGDLISQMGLKAAKNDHFLPHMESSARFWELNGDYEYLPAAYLNLSNLFTEIGESEKAKDYIEHP